MEGERERERYRERERERCFHTDMFKKEIPPISLDKLRMNSFSCSFCITTSLAPLFRHMFYNTMSSKERRENIVLDNNLKNMFHNILVKFTCASVQISFVNPTIYIDLSKQTPSAITEIKVRLLEKKLEDLRVIHSIGLEHRRFGQG